MHRRINLSIPQAMIVVAIIILTITITVLAATGTTDAANAPALASSYTLEDIYLRLTSGTAGSQSTFTEPAIVPGTGSMHDLNQIMSAAPALDNTNGATADQVLQNQTFWGLTNGQWGLQTGTIPDGSNITGSDGSLTFTIPDGYYSSRTATAQDSDLLAGNILAGKNIFGIQGELHGGCTCNGTMVGDTGTRWCDNGNGTITDMQNGCLTWTKNANCLPQSTWRNAMDLVQWLPADNCSLSDGSSRYDWRLPSYIELRELANGTDPVRSSNMQGFTNVQANLYWSSSIQHSDTTLIYSVHLSNSDLGLHNDTDSLNVWAVRGPK